MRAISAVNSAARYSQALDFYLMALRFKSIDVLAVSDRRDLNLKGFGRHANKVAENSRYVLNPPFVPICVSKHVTVCSGLRSSSQTFFRLSIYPIFIFINICTFIIFFKTKLRTRAGTCVCECVCVAVVVILVVVLIVLRDYRLVIRGGIDRSSLL